LRAVRSVLSDEKKLSIAALSQTLPDRLIEQTTRHGLWAPKSTPADEIAKLNAAVVEALADPTVRARFADLGQEIFPREQQTPQALGAFHKAEMENCGPAQGSGNPRPVVFRGRGQVRALLQRNPEPLHGAGQGRNAKRGGSRGPRKRSK
jgi:hypothetical protein